MADHVNIIKENLQAVGIIPARYASTRFPGKPLAMLAGKTMIQRVYEQCLKSELGRVVVATDDERIFQTVSDFGGEVVMTSSHHLSGTDRCGEAAKILQLAEDQIIVNIQGDEPLIEPEAICRVLSLFENSPADIATLVAPIQNLQDTENPNIVKVVVSQQSKALYFSRSKIPYYRNEDVNPLYYRHIGIYAFRNRVLQTLIKLSESFLERVEKLEQLRWLDNGFSIEIAECQYNSIGVDLPEDLVRISTFFQSQPSLS
jgi:3-deoxy-manno-octulosonate cytidylyltransferase (CMP-KDO synthetase)